MKTLDSRLAIGALALACATTFAYAHTDHAAPAPKGADAPAATNVRTPGAPALTAAQREAKARNYFTDSLMLTQEGRRVKFFSDVLKDRVVILSFVYTNCGDACPMITHNLTLAKKQLGEEFGRDVRFVSLSIDPERDTPAEMKRFAAKFGAVHPEWLFLTGNKVDMDRVLKRFGAFTEDPKDHFTGMFLGNLRTDHWRKLRPDTPPELIAAEVRAMAAPPPVAAR